jgi:hypothetical protein
MIALLFYGFWFLYVFFAVFVPWLLFARAKRRTLLSVGTSLFILFIPIAEFLSQFMAFKYECSRNLYFFPETKIEKPRALALTDIGFLNEYSYRERDGAKKLNLFSDFYVDYYVKVDLGDDFSKLTSQEIRSLILDTGEVFPFYYNNKVSQEEKMRLLSEVQYLVHSESETRNGMIIIRDFIYDIETRKAISGISLVSHDKGTSDFHFFDPYEFGVCSPLGEKLYHSEQEKILIKTFK